MIGHALTEQEAEFLFMFWDTMAGSQEPCGLIDIGMATNDLMATLPGYTNGFNSGPDPTAQPGARGKGNLPSQEGGIFAGGSYEADAEAVSMSSHRANAPPEVPYVPAHGGASPARPDNAQKQRSYSNAPSIPGGIFGEDTSAPAANSKRSNRSNASSIEGGIFGAGPTSAPNAVKSSRPHPNASSIPGGIFG